jgi:signal transduction histidine kinase
MEFISKYYLKLYQFIAINRIAKNDMDLRQIHFHLITVITTGILMWSYTLIAYLTIDSPIPGIIGLIMAILHTLSPLLFRWSNNIIFICSFMLLAGVIHQSSFACFTGGFSSHILIWYGIIPMLGGVIAGRPAVKIWCPIVIFFALFFMGLSYNGYEFPNLISEQGTFAAHALLIFGWIIVASVVLYSFSRLVEIHEQKLNDQNTKIDNLLRILMHDMSNSIQVLKGTSTLLVNSEEKGSELESDPQVKARFQSLKRHSDFLSDTIKSIKSMYVVDGLKQHVKLERMELNKSLGLILSILDNRITNKNIKINYDFESNKTTYIKAAPHLFENQILQNILTNAIKFSQPDGIIDILVETNELDRSLFEIIIRDYGIGMPEEMMTNLFNPEYKTSRPGTSKEPGTGLGMYILKDVIEKMDGKIMIKSDVDKGTELKIILQ